MYVAGVGLMILLLLQQLITTYVLYVDHNRSAVRHVSLTDYWCVHTKL